MRLFNLFFDAWLGNSESTIEGLLDMHVYGLLDGFKLFIEVPIVTYFE